MTKLGLAPPPRDLIAADRLGSIYFAVGFVIAWGVGLALAFPLDRFAGSVPPSFVPTIDQLLASEDWRLFIPHYLYALYGVLLMSLGSLLRKRVEAERDRQGVLSVFGHDESYARQ